MKLYCATNALGAVALLGGAVRFCCAHKDPVALPNIVVDASEPHTPAEATCQLDNALQLSLERLIEQKLNAQADTARDTHQSEAERQDRQHSAAQYSGSTIIIASLCSFVTGINVAILVSRFFSSVDVGEHHKGGKATSLLRHPYGLEDCSDVESTTAVSPSSSSSPQVEEVDMTVIEKTHMQKQELQHQLQKLKLEIEKKVDKLNITAGNSLPPLGARQEASTHTDDRRTRQFSTGPVLGAALGPDMSFDGRPHSASSNDLHLLHQSRAAAAAADQPIASADSTLSFVDDTDALSVPSGDEEGATVREVRAQQHAREAMRRNLLPETRQRQTEYSNKCRTLFTELRDGLALAIVQEQNGENIGLQEDASSRVEQSVLAIRDLFDDLSTVFDSASSRVTAMILCCNVVLEYEGLDSLQASKKVAVNSSAVAQKVIETLVPHIWGM